ncbi:hypothetical protein Hte_000292 [Hypoxylon texense]
MSDDDRPRYIAPDTSNQVAQMPPVLAHVCQQSRKVALKTGRMYELGGGTGTWFRPETDVFLWKASLDHLDFEELAGHVRTMVIPRFAIKNYKEACVTFGWLLNEAGFTQLNTIYVEMSYTLFPSVFETWHPEIKTRLFKTDTILIPNLFLAEDEVRVKIDSMSHLLPDELAYYWKSNRAMSFTEVNEWTDHMAEEITSAWVSTQARRTSEIGEDQVKAVENKVLMHPSGISWWAYFANNAPAFTPTCVLTRISDREVVTSIDEDAE